MLPAMRLLSLPRLFAALIVCLIAQIGPGVLLAEPSSSAKELPLAEALTTSGFKSFSEILTASGLLTELGETAYTCFAPTDEAIAAMPAAELKALRDEPKSEATLRWVKYHFIKSEICKKSNFGIIREIITWSGLPTYLSITPTRMWLNEDSTLVKTDMPAKNGIIHGISKALDPRSYMREDDKMK